jgi:hypothetical protein
VLLVWQGDGRNRFITVLFYLSDVDEGSPFAFWPVCPSVCPCSYGCIFVRVSVRTYMRTCKVCTIYHMPIRVRIRTSTTPFSRARTQARALFLSRSHDTCMCAHAHTRTEEKLASRWRETRGLCIPTAIVAAACVSLPPQVIHTFARQPPPLCLLRASVSFSGASSLPVDTPRRGFVRGDAQTGAAGAMWVLRPAWARCSRAAAMPV